MGNNENTRNAIGRKLRSRWFGGLIAFVSVGAAVAYLIFDRGKARRGENAVDDRGTSQRKASQMLRNLRDRAFDADNGKLALALGRPEHEVNAWDTGLEVIDDDVVMKARGIAHHRGVRIE